MRRHEFVGAPDGSQHALRIRGARHLSTEGTHDRDFFFGETFGHEEGDFVSALDPDQGQADAGITGGGFDDCASRPELPVGFGAQNNPAGRPVLHTAAGIEVLQLGKDAGNVVRNQLLELQDGSVADQLGNVVSDAQALAFDGFWLHSTGYGTRKRSVNCEQSYQLSVIPELSDCWKLMIADSCPASSRRLRLVPGRHNSRCGSSR